MLESWPAPDPRPVSDLRRRRRTDGLRPTGQDVKDRVTDRLLRCGVRRAERHVRNRSSSDRCQGVASPTVASQGAWSGPELAAGDQPYESPSLVLAWGAKGKSEALVEFIVPIW